MHICGDAGVELATIPTYAAPYRLVPLTFSFGTPAIQVLLIRTNKAGEELSMHVFLVWAPAGRINDCNGADLLAYRLLG